jgi:hypothetical protein
MSHRARRRCVSRPATTKLEDVPRWEDERMVRRGSTAALLFGLSAIACSNGSGNANPGACALAAGAPLKSGGSCPRSTGAYCAFAGQCPPLDWSDVLSSLAQPRSCWPGSINESGMYDLLLYPTFGPAWSACAGRGQDAGAE